ncbi:MAG: protein jag [Dehalococcoidales bacterium]|nr:protein jag [Dehalococcoidales bacterium]
MDVLEISGKTVDEAVQKALSQLGVTRDQVRITIIHEGKAGGFLGLGAEEARIKVEPISPEKEKMGEILEVAKDTLETLVKLMDIEGTVVIDTYPDETGEQANAPIGFNIEGDDLGILIGRRGQTLASLQYIVRLITGHKTDTWVPIVIDAEGYKQRRIEALQSLAERMADNVKLKGTAFTLEPMPAYERRIIHMTLADDPSVFTESIGDGESRKVVIRPKQAGNGKPRTAPLHENNGRSNYSNGRPGGYNNNRSNYTRKPY